MLLKAKLSGFVQMATLDPQPSNQWRTQFHWQGLCSSPVVLSAAALIRVDQGRNDLAPWVIFGIGS